MMLQWLFGKKADSALSPEKADTTEQSLALISRAVASNPLDPVAHCSLGKTYLEMNRIDEAANCFAQALRLKPDYAEAHYKLGNAVKIQGRLDEALACYQRAKSFKPDYAEAHNNEGAVYQERRQWNEAIASYRAALAINPGLAYAHYNVGLLLLLAAQDRFVGDAVASLRKAVSLSPDFMAARSQLGTALGMLGRHEEAFAVFRQALSISPEFMEARSSLLFYLSHDTGLSPAEVFAEYRAFGDRFEGHFRDRLPDYRNLPDPVRTLRVGFVSADLRAHAVCSFIEPLWAGLDPRQVELWAYSNLLLEDEVTVRLKGLVHQWRTVAAMSDEELAGQIRADGIDILFDLSGHSGGNRLLTFARKPAPIQVSWIGNPNTTGLQAMDYYLADRFSAPPGLLDSLFTEKIVRLPAWASFQPFDEAPEVNDLPALASGVLTFGSFSRGDKLAEGVVALWSRVLNAIPGSRMLLGGVSDASRQANLAEQFARNGIDRGRVIFHARAGMREYLALHHQVDLILDTFPFSGYTVSCHAAWMGVPVLTLAGKTMPSRLGFSINSNLGLPEFIAESEDAFVTQAVRWSRRLPDLAALRASLRPRVLASPLCRTQAFARWLELALRTMWVRWCERKSPESFGIDP